MAYIPAKRVYAGVCFRGCRPFVMFRPPSLLATQVVPTVGYCFYPRPPWFLRPRISRFVTSPSSGYAHRPNRAIDGRGTYTLQDLRPCRPLLGTPNALFCPAPPFDEPVTSAGELHAARQREDAGRRRRGEKSSTRVPTICSIASPTCNTISFWPWAFPLPPALLKGPVVI